LLLFQDRPSGGIVGFTKCDCRQVIWAKYYGLKACNESVEKVLLQGCSILNKSDFFRLLI
jgi:hypothetical protein